MLVLAKANLRLHGLMQGSMMVSPPPSGSLRWRFHSLPPPHADWPNNLKERANDVAMVNNMELVRRKLKIHTLTLTVGCSMATPLQGVNTRLHLYTIDYG